MLILANVAGVGYGLYLWGGEGLEFSTSAWEGFKLWAKLIIGGLLSLFASTFFR